jgi:hypothetical protein
VGNRTARTACGRVEDLFVPEYTDHLTTIADRSEDMKQTIDKFLDYGKTQQKLQRFEGELELAGA